jgi:hypothetical protein
MGYVVNHYRKVSTAVGLKNVTDHNSRTGIYDADGNVLDGVALPSWVSHPELEKLNEGDKTCGLEERLPCHRGHVLSLSRVVSDTHPQGVESVFY